MVSFSYATLPYAQDPSLETSIQRVAEYGYEGIELDGEPSEIDTDEANELLSEYGIEASSINSLYTEDRDMTAPDKAGREQGLQYTKDVIQMAAELDARIVGVAPSPVNQIYPQSDEDQEWQWAIKGMREAADFAYERGVTLAIEPWNRYETYFINTIDDALELLAAVDRENVGIRGDLFHMNIEDDSPADAIRRAGDDLVHLHVADTNRAAPGNGHYDWESVVTALKEISFDNYLTFELLPATADPFAVLEQDTPEARKFYDQYTREAVEFMREQWERY